MIKSLNMLNYFLISEEKKQLALLFIAGLVFVVFETVGLGAVGLYAAVIIDPDAVSSKISFMNMDDLINSVSYKSFVIIISISLVLIFFFKNIYLIFYTYLETQATKKILTRNSLKLYDIYLSKNYLFHINNNPQKLVNNINSTLKMSINFIFYFLNLIREILFITVLIIGLFIINWKYSIIVFLVLSFFSLILSIFLRKRLSIYGENIIDSGKGILKNLNEGIRSIKFSKLLKNFSYLIENYNRSLLQRENYQQKYSILTKLPKFFLEVSSILILVITTIFLIDFIENKNQLATMLALISLIFIRLIPSFIKLNSVINDLKFCKPAYDIILEEYTEDFKRSKLNEIKKANPINNENLFPIKLKKINFQYLEEDDNPKKLILGDLSIEIEKQKMIGIAGKSGAGKTTLVDIIVGFLKPLSGNITLNDIETNLYNNSEWQNLIGYVPQETILNNATILENVAYGIDKKNIDRDLVIECLKKSQLIDFINSLPDKLDTVIEDLGKNISGGQKQRFGLARALYRQPKLLILDEPTSSLDHFNEQKILEDLIQLKDKFSIIIIAHKYSSIKYCDKVYYLKNGQLVNSGNPNTIKNLFN